MMHMSMRYLCLASAALVLAAACKKSSNYNPPYVAPGCISRLTPRVTDLLVSPQKEDSALAAMAAAKISMENLQVSFAQLYPGMAPNGDTVYYVGCNLYLNGLPVPMGNEGYSFLHGALYNWTEPAFYLLNTNDTAGHQDLQYLRRVFLDYMSKAPTPWAHPDYTDSCLTATLCYAPDFLFRQVTGGDHVLIKSWQVSASGVSVFVRDDNGRPQLVPDMVPFLQ